MNKILLQIEDKKIILILEKNFQPRMTWENYGLWHVDHKIPKSVFNYKNAEDLDFQKCWALSNLRPMWARENMSKGANWNDHFSQHWHWQLTINLTRQNPWALSEEECDGEYRKNKS